MPTGDTIAKQGEAFGSGETDNHALKQPGADDLSGSVTRDSMSYDVKLQIIDAGSGSGSYDLVAHLR
jgi:hypothetical protein